MAGVRISGRTAAIGNCLAICPTKRDVRSAPEVGAMTTGALLKHKARRRGPGSETLAARRNLTMRHAEAEGLLGGEESARIAARVSRRLLEAAREKTGIQSDTELLEYALASIALQDDFGDRLFKHEGAVPQDIDLEF